MVNYPNFALNIRPILHVLAISALLLGATPMPHSAKAQDAFITTWETTSDNESITIPTESSSSDYDFEINWGDGTTETITGDDPDPTHTYQNEGKYTVEISVGFSSLFPRIFLDAGVDGNGSTENAKKLKSIEQWGYVKWQSMAKAFAGAENMNYNASDKPYLQDVKDMSFMFQGASDFNGDIGDWNTSGIINMSGMLNSTVFNQDISGWETGNVKDMSGMFASTPFNQALSGWDVSSVTDMSFMFWVAGSFNQDISEWDTGNVTDMNAMFRNATSFNQDLNEWDVSNIDDAEDSSDDSFESIFSGSGLSSTNYDRTLIGWSRLDLVEDISFGATGLTYCNSGPFRSHLEREFGWTISDDGQASGCPDQLVGSGTQSVSSDGSVVLGDTGMRVVFNGTGGSGRITGGRLDDAPRNVEGITESNVSPYRLVIVDGPNLSFSDQTEVRFDESQLGGFEDPNNVTVYSRPIPGTGSFASLTTNYDDTEGEIVAETGSFSELVLASDSEPLPVEMAGFDARIENQTVSLSWKTASETGNSGFEVQRKSAGRSTWSDIGFVESGAENETTDEPQSYRFADEELPFAADTLEYRLRQVDLDGTVAVSDSVTVARSTSKYTLKLKTPYPNPTSKQVTLQYVLPRKMEVSILIYDVLGRQVETIRRGMEDTGRTEIQISTSSLSPGTYFLQIQAGEKMEAKQLTVMR